MPPKSYWIISILLNLGFMARCKVFFAYTEYHSSNFPPINGRPATVRGPANAGTLGFPNDHVNGSTKTHTYYLKQVVERRRYDNWPNRFNYSV